MWDTLVECRIRLHKALVAANCLPLPESWQSLINTSSTSPASPLSLDSFQEESKHSVAQLTQSLLHLHTLLAKNLTVKEKKLPQKVVRKEEVNDSDEMDETEDEGEDNTCEASKDQIAEKSLNSDDDDLHDSHEEDDDDDDDESIQVQTDRQQSHITSDNRIDVDFTTDEAFVLTQDALNDVHSIDTVIEDRMQKLSGKKNAILHEWFHRTRFSVAQGLESFEQPPLTQITAILANKKRLIKRTQLKRCEYNSVGTKRKLIDDSTGNEETEDATEAAQSKLSDLVAYESKNNQETNYDVEIFNDDDFYHQLLKELIDTKAADSTDSLSLSKKWQAIQKMRGKMRKVDTRASKGRKIRFKVHKEIVNFMAPIPLTSMDENARSALFTSLFSH